VDPPGFAFVARALLIGMLGLKWRDNRPGLRRLRGELAALFQPQQPLPGTLVVRVDAEHRTQAECDLIWLIEYARKPQPAHFVARLDLPHAGQQPRRPAPLPAAGRRHAALE